MSNEFNLITSLSPEECVSRLVAAIDHESLDLQRLHFATGSKPVIGEVTTGTFILHKRIMGRNSFKTVATGTIQPSANGTAISGQFSAHPGFRLGYKAWGCCAVFIGLPIAANLLYDLLSGTVHWNGLWGPSYQAETMGLVILTALPLLFAIGRGSAAGDDDFLWQFLINTLEARLE